MAPKAVRRSEKRTPRHLPRQNALTIIVIMIKQTNWNVKRRINIPNCILSKRKEKNRNVRRNKKLKKRIFMMTVPLKRN